MTKPEDTTRTAQLASGVSALVQIVTAPPHLPNLGTVTTRAVECLRIGTHHLQIPDKLFQLIEDLDRSTSSVQSPSSPTLLFGLSGDFPAWTMLAGSTFPADSSSKKALGAAITIAWLRGVQIQKSLISELRSLIKKRADEAIDVTKYEAESKKLADRQTKKLIAVLQIYGSGLNSQEVNQQVKLQSALKARFSSLRIVERQAAGRSNELPQSQLEEATRGLWNKAKSGCGNSLAALLVFCVGLPWDIGLAVPLAHTIKPGTYACWISSSGWIGTDLGFLLENLGKTNSPRFLATSTVLWRPLPQDLAAILLAALAANPSIRTIGDLLDEPVTSRKRLNLANIHPSSSLSQFLKSAPGAALRATGMRDVAAFSTLGFELITESDLHYVTIPHVTVWRGCDSMYKSVGLGYAIPITCTEEIFIGSKRTPDVGWIQDIFREAIASVEGSRCGRRYTLASLIDFHNKYAECVYLYAQLCAGGRDRTNPCFSSKAWGPNSAFGLLFDKPLGATGGQSPIPQSSRLTLQVGYWRAHLQCLLRRLLRLGMLVGSVVQHVWDILNLQDVNLFFKLDLQGQILPLDSTSAFQGTAADLNKDFSRHFWPKVFRERGLPFEDSQDFLRHSASGISSHHVTSLHSNWSYLYRTAEAIDQTLFELGINPVPGLVREVV